MNSKNFFLTFGKTLYHIDYVYSEIAKEVDVPATLLWIMYAINDGKMHTQKEICYDWDLPKSTVNTIITQLKNDGFIYLNPIKGKKREMYIILTEKGKEFANNITNRIFQMEEKIFSNLSFNKETFLDNLIEIENNLKKERQNEKN